ncbi:MAG: FAD:protein FMN transferase [Cycloclasticus sp.]
MNLFKRPVKNAWFLTGFFIFIVLLTGCESPRPPSVLFKGQTMGTSYHVTLSTTVSASDSEALQKDIDDVLLQVNQSFSTYIKSSEISELNRYTDSEGQTKSQEFIALLEEALRISDITQGAYDITVGPLVNLWGFGPEFKADDVPSSVEITKALEKVGHKNIVIDRNTNQVKKLNPGIYLDFSSIAKGYGVDKVAELVESEGFTNYMVEIGGEMRVRGVNPQGNNWRVAIEKPDVSARSIYKVINVTNIAIATSGDYRNFFEIGGIKFSHTIDPNTGRPVQHNLASVTVLDKSSMTADAWATAFMVLGSKKGYDLAMVNNLAVLFLIQEGDSIKDMATPRFEAIIKEQAL